MKKSLNSKVNTYNNLVSLCKDLRLIKKQVIKKRIMETKQLIKENKSLLQVSTFELMEYDFHENTHSNILKYLFDYNINGKIGTKILSAFLDKINNDNTEFITPLIKYRNYSVEREYFINKGRIDLLVIDHKNHFLIVIENKINADVGIREGINENNIPKTQLNVYYNFIEEHFKEYTKLYILLSYKEIGSDHEPFLFIDYLKLYDILTHVNITDVILNQYTLLLHSLTHQLYDKREMIDKINSLDSNTNIELNTLELLKGAIYERF